jgi:hypothetical protein
VTRGKFFALEDGTYHTIKGTSAFALLAKYQNGESIISQLVQWRSCGFNMLRVWTAFSIDTIGVFTTLDYSVIPGFVSLCADFGFHVEFTAYTGINDPTHWGKLCDAALQCSPRPLLELVNELSENTNEADDQGRIFNLSDYTQAPAPLLSSHGSNGSQQFPVRPWWSYELFHTNGAPEWWRKAGNGARQITEGVTENGIVYAGSGVPTIADENTRYTDKPDTTLEHAYDAAMAAALLCAGSTFHSVEGKAAVLFGEDTEEAARAWCDGANSIDLRFQDGAYRRADELLTADMLRVYQRVLNGEAETAPVRK